MKKIILLSFIILIFTFSCKDNSISYSEIPPTLISPKSHSYGLDTSITLIWESESDAYEYEVICVEKKEYRSYHIWQNPSSYTYSNSIKIDGLKKGTEYIWQVRSIYGKKKHNSKSSEWSLLWSFFTVDKYLYDFNTVVIGEQEWMTENLNIAYYRNGDSIQQKEDFFVGDWGQWCNYESDSSLGEIYGKLYNWYAVTDERGLAPQGWRIPTEKDWDKLTEYLGNNSGSKIAMESDLWQNGVLLKKEFVNMSGFNGIPGGYRNDDNIYYYHYNYSDIGKKAYWWTSTEKSELTAKLRYISIDNTEIMKYNHYKTCGFSVRCVRDVK